MILNFVIREKAQAKQSARFYVDDFGKLKSYQNRKIKDFENLVRFYFMQQCRGHKAEFLKDRPLSAEIIVCIKIPQSWSKIKKEKALKDEIRPTVKPDCDNIAKNILDSLNKVAYSDDKQIVELSIKKYYAEDDHIQVRIGTL